MARTKPEKPLHKQCAEFVCHHLADKRAFAPFTGTDFDAWHAYIHLVRLWGRTRSDVVIDAMRSVVHSAQHRHEDVMAVFKKSIPCLLDWSDERSLWLRIGPRTVRDVDIDFAACLNAKAERVMWPFPDGPRICRHENSRPYKHAVPEPGYTLDQQCRDCGAIWREKLEADRA